MNAAIKLTLGSLLAAILLLNPIGACASTMQSTTTPAHPCCPAKPMPLSKDCARPGCIYMDTQVISTVAAPVDDATPLSVLPTIVQPLCHTPTATVNTTASIKPLLLALFVQFHQFRV